MGKKDPRVDAYISKAKPFAQPILKQIRKNFHANCPDVEETLKWGMPSFMYKGILAGMAGFNHHCTLGFWKHKLVVGHDRNEDAMGSFGRITDVSQLPNDKNMAILIKKAMKLNDDGIKPVKKPKPKNQKPLVPPAYFLAALKKNKKAKTLFDNFSPSKRKDYIEWVTEAKTDETRDRRLATAVEWMSEGKARNWKYENC